MNDRTSIIDSIITARHERQDEIMSRLNTVSSLTAALAELKERSSNIQSKVSDDFHVSSQLRSVDDKINEASEKIEKLRTELQRFKKRTLRNTLNIGIVGVPKQGKSTFLQALTGLDEATIPTGTDFVTGACSYLRHDIELKPGEAYAVVTPYTRKEFLDEVLKPFCKSFNLDLDSVDGLPYLTLPDKEGLKESDKRMLERLESLKMDYAKYETLLGTDTKRIEKHEIREYVAQRDESGKQAYTNWYAIKKAVIHCRFPQEDIGRIMICDTPGLGDFTPGAQQMLMEKLSSDMDVVFFMKQLHMTDQTISERDTEFHGVVQDANPLINVSDWAYMILNCREGEAPSDIFLENLRSKLPTRMGAQQLNAKSQTSVSNCFDSVLKDIVNQIPKIDDKLINSYTSLVEDVKNAVNELATCAKKVKLVKATAGALLATSLMKELLDSLYEKFAEYKQELSKDGPSSLAPQIEKIIGQMREHPPVFKFSPREAAQPINCYSKGKNIMRARFIAEFSDLDSTMGDMIKKVRQRVMEILTSKEGARLGFLLGNEDDGSFWDNLRESLRETLSEEASRHLIQAIDNVTNIEMTFRAFILPRLTEITDGLSNKPIPQESPFYPYTFNQGTDTFEVCLNKLNSAWLCAVGHSEALFDEEDGKLRDVNTTPSSAMIALVEEFELLWFHYNGDDEAQAILNAYYEKHQNEVWPELFVSDDSMLKVARMWDKSVSNFVASAKQLH